MWKRFSVIIAAVILTLPIGFGALPTAAAPPSGASILPAGSSAYGSSLTDWLGAYFRWYYTGGASATDPYQPGAPPIVFMPLPSGNYLRGSFTSEDPGYLQGELDVTIKPGTSFVLPLFSWVAERYNTGQADDPTIPNELVQSTVDNPDGTGVPEVTLDNRPILRNFWDYYVGPQAFDPVVTYPEPSSYGSIAAIAYQGVGFVMPPLTPGTHRIHLLERLRVTNAELPGYPLPYDIGVIYDNTWIIHVRQ